ncbi:MAG: hypothetical protein GY711_03410 [bacterium]|nr:hypothetical protein [bacterium]
MLLASALLTALPAGPIGLPSAFCAPDQDLRAEVKAQYQALFEKLDGAGLRKLWSEHPDLVLITFDADLEGSLKIHEATPDGSRQKEADALRDRALWGATVASDVTGRPVFADYAISFAGWGEAERKQFRSGQASYKDGMQAFRKGAFAVALAAGTACRDAAEPLGDWWGTAMGLTLEGMALEARGEHERALRRTSRARLLNNALGLRGSEYQNLRGMISQLTTLRRWERAHLTADAAVTIARERKDTAGVIENLGHRARIERALGFERAAEATEKQVKELGD